MNNAARGNRKIGPGAKVRRSRREFLPAIGYYVKAMNNDGASSAAN
jgi:hypothetical protein